MAIVRLVSGRELSISYEDRERGYHIWRVLNGEEEPANEEQAKFMLSVKNIYLNRFNDDCPISYLEARRHIHEQMAGSMRRADPWYGK